MSVKKLYKSIYKTTGLCLVGLLFSILSTNAFSSSITNNIKVADEIKSTDFNKFSEILHTLQENYHNLDVEEKEFVTYLSAYHKAYSGDQVEAIRLLSELSNETTQSIIKIKSIGVIVNILVLSRKYSEVFNYLDQFNQLLDVEPDNDTKSLGLALMALVFNQINQFEDGLYYADNLVNVTNNARYLCAGHQLRLESLHRLGRDSLDEALINHGIQLCETAEQPIYKNIILSFKVESLIESNPSDAIELLNSVDDEVKKTSYKILTSSFQAFYSKAYLKLGRLDMSEQHALEALSQLSPNDVNPAVLIVYEALYDLYKAKGDYINALKYHETLVAKQKTYEDEKAAGLLAYNLAKAQVEVKNQRIELLNKDNELLFLQKNVIEQEVRQTRVLMAVLAVVLSIALYLAYKGLTGRRRFKKIAEFDQLTGISNRYHFNNQAELALEFCQKNNQPAAVILFDLDHFKQINDNHGHAAGDWALQAVVGTCRHFMRNNDVFGRIGGEEFAVVLPGCQTDKAALLAEICRDAIAAIDTEESGTAFPLTASFGVSGSDSSGYQLKQLLADADKAMYRAKDGGRDQVVSFAEA